MSCIHVYACAHAECEFVKIADIVDVGRQLIVCLYVCVHVRYTFRHLHIYTNMHL